MCGFTRNSFYPSLIILRTVDKSVIISADYSDGINIKITSKSFCKNAEEVSNYAETLIMATKISQKLKKAME